MSNESRRSGVKAYFADPSLSQSTIKGILKGPHMVNVLKKDPYYFTEKETLLIGNLVDDYLAYSSYDTMTYHKGDVVDKPSEVICSIIRKAFDKRINNIMSDNTMLLLQAAKDHGYGNGKYSDDRIMTYLLREQGYWNGLIELGGRTLITQGEYDLAITMANNIKNSEFTKEYFANTWINPSDYQVPLFFEQDGVKCKALLDYVRLDVANKTIQPFDFKMTAYTTTFGQPYHRFKYGIQARWYLRAIEANKQRVITQLMNTVRTSTAIRADDWKIDEFKFIVESYINPGTPLIYSMSQEQKDEADDLIAKGLDLYKWHTETGIWDMSKEIHESKGQLVI